MIETILGMKISLMMRPTRSTLEQVTMGEPRLTLDQVAMGELPSGD
jgi:hypothetical protein